MQPLRTAALLLALTSACGLGASFVKTGEAPASARRASQVEVFTAGPPQRPYAERGIIQIRGYGLFAYDAPLEDVVKKARQAGSENGCDAVVLRQATSTERDVFSNASGARTDSTATCIVFTQGASAAL